jgi:hypothetical protein
MGSVTFGPEGVKWGPGKLSSERIKGQIPIVDWWQQAVYILGSVRLTRRTLTLGAADKDGGAHVDATLTPEYESLTNATGKGFFNIVDAPGSAQSPIPITNAHLVYLRQIGFEVLNSPELLALAR